MFDLQVARRQLRAHEAKKEPARTIDPDLLTTLSPEVRRYVENKDEKPGITTAEAATFLKAALDGPILEFSAQRKLSLLSITHDTRVLAAAISVKEPSAAVRLLVECAPELAEAKLLEETGDLVNAAFLYAFVAAKRQGTAKTRLIEKAIVLFERHNRLTPDQPVAHAIIDNLRAQLR